MWGDVSEIVKAGLPMISDSTFLKWLYFLENVKCSCIPSSTKCIERESHSENCCRIYDTDLALQKIIGELFPKSHRDDTPFKGKHNRYEQSFGEVPCVSVCVSS